MADPRFFARRGPFTLAQLAEKCGAVLAAAEHGGQSFSDVAVSDVAPLDKAGPGDLSFIDNPKYLADFQATRATACFVAEKHLGRAPKGLIALVSATPYRSYALAAQMFYPSPEATPGIHPSAVIDPSAEVAPSAEIGAGAVIAARARIGAGTSIGANTVVGTAVAVGANCRIGPLVVLSHCDVGDRVTIHPGVKIGQDGFGFAPDPRGHVKVPQLGRVQIGQDCEIGANTTIDRGAGPDTVIGPGCWIDNLVQIGHNVQIGRGAIIIAQSGIAGSTRLGDFVAVGAQGGLTGHLSIGSGARIAAQSGVMRDVAPGETVGGSPAVPQRQWLRQVAMLGKLSSGKEDSKK